MKSVGFSLGGFVFFDRVTYVLVGFLGALSAVLIAAGSFLCPEARTGPLELLRDWFFVGVFDAASLEGLTGTGWTEMIVRKRPSTDDD